MTGIRHLAYLVADAVVAGPLDEESIVRRVAKLHGKRWRWIRPLARRLAARCQGRAAPRRWRVEQWLRHDNAFRRACLKDRVDVSSLRPEPPAMCPVASVSDGWQLPPIVTPGQLAQWLDIPPRELRWLADPCGLERRGGAQQRYRYRLLAKGTSQFRLIEAPIFRLKRIQQRLQSELLSKIPPHEAAHGFRRGRSIRSFAAPHAGREVVLRMDLADFFPSLGFGRVAGLFRAAGYPEAVADLLASLTTTAAPDEVWERDERVLWEQLATLRRRYGAPHLPQGAPTSPAIANLCAHRLDRRLSGLAAACQAVYTRYADDLVFSGDAPLARCVDRARHHIAAIAIEEGFAVNFRKTRIMRRGARQRIAGLVVNRHVNVSRADFDRLKATLCNCLRHGPATQNRKEHSDFRAHLTGRVAFVESVNPPRGQKLRRLLEQIDWDS